MNSDWLWRFFITSQTPVAYVNHLKAVIGRRADRQAVQAAGTLAAHSELTMRKIHKAPDLLTLSMDQGRFPKLPIN